VSSRGALACGLTIALGACGGRSSDITVAYRGDVAAYRQLVRVTLDSGARARTVTPAFPSAARAQPVGTSGTLPVSVVMLSGSDTIVRFSPTPLSLAPNTSYVVSVIVSARAPIETRCTGRWAASPIVAREKTATDSGSRGSLYVSIAKYSRDEGPPECSD
jgi:hypothetical protein